LDSIKLRDEWTGSDYRGSALSVDADTLKVKVTVEGALDLRA